MTHTHVEYVRRERVRKVRKGRQSTKNKMAKAWGWIRRNIARSFPKANPSADHGAE